MENKTAPSRAASPTASSSKSFRGRPMGPDDPVEITARGCLDILGELAPLSGKLEKLFAVPETIFVTREPGGFTTFSSEPEKNIASVFGSLLLGRDLPPDLPGYGIHVSSKGGSVFCVLLDRSRRIIVFEAVKEGYSDSGSWEAFSDSVERAVSKAEFLEESGQKFSFVISREGALRMI